ncbi:MAG: ammonium transporter [Chlamydiae bacterium]|nr:ammonium transporter [Chlamydiota bacterium]MBI3266342.1 ammonium transporter [Chlamydiota bacterium]
MRGLKLKAQILLAVIGIGTLLSCAASVKAGALTDEDVSSIKGPDTSEIAAKGDPGAEMTGTANDVSVSDTSKGLSLADLVNQAGQNKIAINFVWTLITGFLVMFMQAGFALVETGLIRAKNANHTMMMNFMVYGLGLFAYYVCGFAIQMGGCAPIANLGGVYPLNHEFAINLFGKPWALFGTKGFFLSGTTYDVGVMVLFLFQMVFMDTTTTIVTGSCAERWKYSAFCVSSIGLGALIYPLFGNWAWGCGWLSQLGVNFGLGHGYCDFAGSGVVHAVGGITALAVAMQLGPRIGKFNKDGTPNAIPGHDIVLVLCGCFILAFGWFGFNPGSTLGASGNGCLRIGSVAVNTMLAGCTGSFGALLYMWIRYGKPDASMAGNGLLAGLVAITSPSGFVNPLASAVIGWIAGVLVCLAVEFFDRVPKLDDPVGAMSVHGVNGLWGVIAVGLFADGRSNYGGSWNGVSGGVKGLFYGDAGQLVAQLIGVATLVGIIFTLSFVWNWLVDVVVGQRSSAQAEMEGLDIPEMGALCYPDFQLKAE